MAAHETGVGILPKASLSLQCRGPLAGPPQILTPTSLNTFLLHPCTSPHAHVYPASSLADRSPHLRPPPRPGSTWERQGRRPWEGIAASEHLTRAKASRFGTVPLYGQPGQSQLDTLHHHTYQAGWPAGRLTFLYLWGKVNLSMVFCTAPRVTFPSLSSSCSSSCKEKNMDVSTCVQRHTDTRGKGERH